MLYSSTRSATGPFVQSAEAIKRGLAPDGGLYMPGEIPVISQDELEEMAGLPYPERAARILGKFLTDYSEEELLSDCREAYGEERFPGGAAPLSDIDGNTVALELWHGPTCAFKDMALQIMPRLLSRALRKTGELKTALILVATSGDTGKAALEGYRDVRQTKIQVFYPVDGVSRVQKLQMATQTGNNVNVTAIRGNFDDAQTGVKQIFSDAAIREKLGQSGVILSSANSINWGRLAPQIAYYVSAYCDMVASSRIGMGDVIDVTVPTGNFGNIFAAYLAKKMGVPFGRLICASNRNDVLTEFFACGVYDRNRSFHTTMSPSMDILISSNLERLLFVKFGARRCKALMEQLNATGRYALTHEELSSLREDFVGYSADEDKTAEAIKYAWDAGYLADPHTAVGYAAIRADRNARGRAQKILLASTASPYKFAANVFRSLTGKEPQNDLSALRELSALTSTPIPVPLQGIGERTVRFTGSVAPEEMPARVLEFAGV